MGDKEYITEMIMSYLRNGNKRAVFIKQQDVYDVDIEKLCSDVIKNLNITLIYHDYSTDNIKKAYEPFMTTIKDAYYNYYQDNFTIEEFVDSCGVYSLQQELFVSFIKNGICQRKIEVMLNEYDYESERILESVYSALKYISKNKKLVFVIKKLHEAPVCILRFITTIFNREDDIKFVVTYGENFLVKEYCDTAWHELLQKAEDDKLFFVVKAKPVVQNIDVHGKFEYKEESIKEYIRLISNMVLLFAFEDARYYLEVILSHIDRIDSKVSDDDIFTVLELMGQVCLGTDNFKDALLICEKMVPFFKKDGVYREYIYNICSAKAHLLMAETNIAHKFCEKGKLLARKMKDEIKLMNVDVVEIIAEFGGFKDLFRGNYTRHISDEVIKRVKETGNENFLAYIYTFGFENDDETIRQIGLGKMSESYFDRGIEIAKKLDNKNLLLNAYMKNIILYTDHGFHGYVRQMYENRLKILDKEKLIRIAHTYAGLGYNAIVLEDYKKAEDYLYRCLEIVIDKKEAEDIAETIYNMFMNYYVAGENQRAIQCIELLLRIMKLIHIEGLRICNTSKMYGFLALAYFKEESYFDCYYCVDKMETVMSYVLSNNNEEVQELWLEDLFLFHLCKANIYSLEGKVNQAQKHFNKAFRYMHKREGIKFYSYYEYAIFYSRFLIKNGNEEQARKILKDTCDYCSNNSLPKKAALLRAELDNRRVYREMLSSRQIPEKEIIEICNYVGARTELEKRKKDIDFLTICHDIMGMQGCDVWEVVQHTMNLIRNSFSFDRLLFLEKDDTQNIITYANENVFLKNDDVETIAEFFIENKSEFISSRLENNFSRYGCVVEKMGGDEIVTIVGIPVFKHGVLRRFFVATIDVHRSFTANRRLPDYNDLEVIKCAINQLDEAIARIKSDNTIRNMNSQLEKAAFTDQLTGIYNRMGFDKILGDNIAQTGVVLYMDLDNFKKYNDTYGHDAGDTILKGFASIIKNSIGEVGYAIRYGGDEFVVVIPEKNEEFAKTIASEIQNRLREDLEIQNAIEGEMITSSVGISVYEKSDRRGLQDALKWADKALYYVKAKNKGNVATKTQIDNVM